MIKEINTGGGLADAAVSRSKCAFSPSSPASATPVSVERLLRWSHGVSAFRTVEGFSRKHSRDVENPKSCLSVEPNTYLWKP